MSIENYLPIRLLGKGSFGSVYLMRDKVKRTFVCVKVIKIKNIPKKERESTRVEVDLLRRLNHPNIVRYFESFLSKNGDTLCICMEYCDGGDLASQIKAAANNLFSENKILHWFVQIALGLHYMHSNKVLHRDLKTQNVFLLGNGRLVLGDFGISKVLDGTMDFAQTCIGTPYYMSPEIFQNKPYSYKSDVWALGCILYEMTTLNHAFDSNSLNSLAGKIVKGRYPPINPKYSRSLRDLIADMLLINPQQRPDVDQILRKSFIKKHIINFLSDVVSRPTGSVGEGTMIVRAAADGIVNGQMTSTDSNVSSLQIQLKELDMAELLTEAVEPKELPLCTENATKIAREQRSALQREVEHRRVVESALERLRLDRETRLRNRNVVSSANRPSNPPNGQPVGLTPSPSANRLQSRNGAGLALAATPIVTSLNLNPLSSDVKNELSRNSSRQQYYSSRSTPNSSRKDEPVTIQLKPETRSSLPIQKSTVITGPTTTPNSEDKRRSRVSALEAENRNRFRRTPSHPSVSTQQQQPQCQLPNPTSQQRSPPVPSLQPIKPLQPLPGVSGRPIIAQDVLMPREPAGINQDSANWHRAGVASSESNAKERSESGMGIQSSSSSSNLLKPPKQPSAKEQNQSSKSIQPAQPLLNGPNQSTNVDQYDAQKVKVRQQQRDEIAQLRKDKLELDRLSIIRQRALEEKNNNKIFTEAKSTSSVIKKKQPEEKQQSSPTSSERRPVARRSDHITSDYAEAKQSERLATQIQSKLLEDENNVYGFPTVVNTSTSAKKSAIKNSTLISKNNNCMNESKSEQHLWSPTEDQQATLSISNKSQKKICDNRDDDTSSSEDSSTETDLFEPYEFPRSDSEVFDQDQALIEKEQELQAELMHTTMRCKELQKTLQRTKSFLGSPKERHEINFDKACEEEYSDSEEDVGNESTVFVVKQESLDSMDSFANPPPPYSSISHSQSIQKTPATISLPSSPSNSVNRDLTANPNGSRKSSTKSMHLDQQEVSVSSTSGILIDRINRIRQKCIEGLGREKFREAYRTLQDFEEKLSLMDGRMLYDDDFELEKMTKLRSIVGESDLKYVALIEQLLFMEETHK